MNLKLTKIKKIERISFRGYLYDITSNPYHNFLANNILVHNSEGTMGRRIQKGWREIPLQVNGKTNTMKLNMEVNTIDGLSGHADMKELVNFVQRMRSRPERIIVNHGEGSKALQFASSLHKFFRTETLAPKNLEAIRLR